MTNQSNKKAVFIHQLLPGLFFKNPSVFIKTFKTTGNEYGLYLWNNLSSYIENYTEIDNLTFNCSNFNKKNAQLIIIEFDGTTEKDDCLAIGFVYREVSNTEHGIERVFTAEMDGKGEKNIDLYEWDEAIHRKIKQIDFYSRDKFLNEIVKIISELNTN